ncbi:MAG: hypothetical protein ACI8X5_002395 [Planctomycetota bacterium]
MRFESNEYPGRSLRLAYCLNLHAADNLEGCIDGIRKITLPLRDRLSPAASFGIGMYLPGTVALRLASGDAVKEVRGLADFLTEERLDPFTFNAFPFGGFHTAGLKRGVFAPTWCEAERADYTIAVAEIAAQLNGPRPGHLSISTHPGRFGPWEAGELETATKNFARVLRSFADIAERGGPIIRLSVEAEPRAAAGDTTGVNRLLVHLRDALVPEFGEELVRAHLGACLDACHSAVEFESAQEAVQLATVLPLGKLQYSSAIALRSPGANAAARQALFALDEPRYLHQTTGRLAQGFLRADDLPELQELSRASDSPWLSCEEWRTHFHVPVDLESLPDSGLETTREHAAAILRELLAGPATWGSEELHVEIETYTWEILPGAARGLGELIDGLEREYLHVLSQLKSAAWSPR